MARPTESSTFSKPGLVLSGGGARGAYQAGVIKGVAEIASDLGINNPLPILTGVSAGAINASYLASHCDNFSLAANKMAAMWSHITAEQIFKTDALSAGRSGLRFITDATVGALYTKKLARSLLDTAPLNAFLAEHIPFERIAGNIRSGHLDALAITAMNYTTSTSITFVQGNDDVPMWVRSRRISERATIQAPHVMASSALPIFFPPIHVGESVYGDGCLRNTAPLSPAIHLGAQRLMVVSVRRPDDKAAPVQGTIEPSVARVLGVILNAVILDAADVDVERMSRVNATLSLVPAEQKKTLALRPVDYLWIRPSVDIGHLAGDLFDRLPRVIRYLMKGLGSSREAAEITSYLLFDPDFCGQLVNVGYQDALDQRTDIAHFLKG